MKFGARDLKKLRWHIALALAMLAAAGAVAVLSWTARQQVRAEHDRIVTRHSQAATRLHQVHFEEEEIKAKAAIFARLEKNGILGEERRLDWTETLRDIQRRQRIPAMSYEFAPQHALPGGSSGQYAFYASKMKLHLQLAHEEELLHFLQAVQQEAKAMVQVDSCHLTRLPADGTPPGFSRLRAECELEWLTARPGQRVAP